MGDIHQWIEDQSERLTQWAVQLGLELVTPYREVTFVYQGQRDNTIHHCWASRAAGVRYERLAYSVLANTWLLQHFLKNVFLHTMMD